MMNSLIHTIQICKPDWEILTRFNPADILWQFSEWTQEQEKHGGKLEVPPLAFLPKAKGIFQEFGFVIIDFNGIDIDLDKCAGNVSQVVSYFGHLIRVFSKPHPFWRVLDVDTSRPQNRSRGTGKLSLHMDFVNASNPPDVVCLFCVVEDPNGGGHSLIANIENLEQILRTEDCALLRKCIYSDGIVNNLLNIGDDVNPFAVFSDHLEWTFRYTTNLLGLDLDVSEHRALESLNSEIEKRAISFPLKKGQLLLMDQHKVLHGREPLGKYQDEIPYSERRLVYHSFLRYS